MVTRYLNPSHGYSLNQRFRENRFKSFFSLLERVKHNKPIRILDIGGTEIYWERMNFTENKNIHITLLNLKEVSVKNNNFRSIKGEACDLSFCKDKEFDTITFPVEV